MSIITYLNETKAEMQKVKWPETKTVIWMTVVVILISIITAYFLGLFDIIFSRLIGLLIN